MTPPPRLPRLHTTRLPAIAGAALIAAITLGEYAFGWDAGIDRLLAADGGTLRAPGRMMPLTAVILLAALQAIPQDLYQAAKLDGAGAFKCFRLITLPLIASGLAIALSQSTVFAFNLFDEAWILAGSSLDTRTVIIQVYMLAFQNMRFSLGMALSLLAMLASLLVSLLYVLKVYRETRFD